jgi:ribosomal protein S18 acetylase RimI-like enzyme
MNRDQAPSPDRRAISRPTQHHRDTSALALPAPDHSRRSTTAPAKVLFVRENGGVTEPISNSLGVRERARPGDVAAARDDERQRLRLEVVSPSDVRAVSALHAFMDDIASRYYGRPATEEEIRAGLRDYPSDDLQPPRGVLVVAHRPDAVMGCAGLRFVDAELGEVTRVYVAPSARRRGVARALMTEVERRARERGIRYLRLDTRADLVEARRLYERIGYREIPRFNESPYADHSFAKRLL